MLEPKEIVELIKSLDRVGCGPFRYLGEDVFLNFSHYEEVEFDYQSEFIQWDSVKTYGHDYKARIDRKCKTQDERDKYYKIYEKEIPPVILDEKGYPLDGYHRLARFKKEKATFIAYVGVRKKK